MATSVQTTKKPTNPKRKNSAEKYRFNNEEEFPSAEINSIPVQRSGEEIVTKQPLEQSEQHTTQQELEECAEYFNKLKTLQYALEIDLLACDAKWALFVSAAFSYRYDSMLQPYPPQFAIKKSGYDIDSLMSVIKDTPKLCIVLQNLMEQSYEEQSSEVIDLLYWVLIEMGEPTLRLMEGEELKSLFNSIDEKPMKIRPTHVFEVHDLSGFHSELEFRARTSNLPLKVGFMGNKLDNYFSILQAGFAQFTENNNNLKLTTDLQTSLKHSPYCAAWGASQCGSIISCTAICEFAVNAEEDKITANKNDKSCVDIHLCNPQNIRLRYLVFYGRRFPRSLLAKGGVLSWFCNHKYSISVLSYILLLVSIGIANSDRGEILKLYVYNKIELFLGFCRRIITKEPSQ